MTFDAFTRRVAALLLLVFAGLGTPQPSQAGYYQWDPITLPLVTGASCGNGAPYRFFVNRAWRARDTVIVFEGGGACWDQASCEGRGSLAASNPNGISENYLNSGSNAAFGLVTPFSSRLNPFERVRTQDWNMVYLPYCTGDVHTGNQVRTYDDADPAAPRVQHHKGQANVQAVAQWIRSQIRNPRHVLVTGFSAGGVGATANYVVLRDVIAPAGRMSLLADSGPMFPAPRGASPDRYPSILLHERIRSAWGLDGPAGLLAGFAGLAGYDAGDLGSIPTALALRYPQDRFAYMSFIADGTFSAFSYAKFHPEIAEAPDDATRKARLAALWDRDLDHWVRAMLPHPNVSYHLPYFRPFAGSHCLTLVDFSGTGIEEVGLWDIKPFIDNTLERGPPLRHVETDRVTDLLRPLGLGLQRLLRLSEVFGG
jgi:hypothetical protein